MVAIMIGAILISTIPLIDPLKDIFVDRLVINVLSRIISNTDNNYRASMIAMILIS